MLKTRLINDLNSEITVNRVAGYGIAVTTRDLETHEVFDVTVTDKQIVEMLRKYPGALKKWQEALND